MICVIKDHAMKLLAYTDDINFSGDNINTTKDFIETLLEATRDVGLEINAENTKYMIMFRHQNSGQNQNIRTVNESFENVAKFKYLETTPTKRMTFMMKSRAN
jgi:hypothetical protein